MKKVIISLLVCLIGIASITKAQVFPVDTIAYRGDITKYINIVVMGDGYTSTQQNTFRADADSLISYLFTQSPWSHYAGYFNVFAIRVVSAQSGTRHPNTASDCAGAGVPVSNPNTYFDCAFDYGGIHRLVVANNNANVAAVLSANFPAYDQVLIIANTPYYGGSGGPYPVSTVNSASREITAHEIGHSFAGLADEYYAGDGYAFEQPNMTAQSNASLVKWKNWTGYNSIGAYQHCCGGMSASWYKPTSYACKMEALGLPYCNVCGQALIESIHSLVNPIVSYTPAATTVSQPQQYISFVLSKLMKPQPNTLNIQWKLDNTVISNNTDSVIIDQNTLTTGAHTLVARVIDTTALLRVDGHATIHVSTVTWTINKATSGIALTTADNQVSCAIYPNPADKQLNISFETEKKTEVSIALYSIDGKLIEQLPVAEVNPGKYTNAINIESLTLGAYLVTIKMGSYIHQQQWVKR